MSIMKLPSIGATSRFAVSRRPATSSTAATTTTVAPSTANCNSSSNEENEEQDHRYDSANNSNDNNKFVILEPPCIKRWSRRQLERTETPFTLWLENENDLCLAINIIDEENKSDKKQQLQQQQQQQQCLSSLCENDVSNGSSGTGSTGTIHSTIADEMLGCPQTTTTTATSHTSAVTAKSSSSSKPKLLLSPPRIVRRLPISWCSRFFNSSGGTNANTSSEKRMKSAEDTSSLSTITNEASLVRDMIPLPQSCVIQNDTTSFPTTPLSVFNKQKEKNISKEEEGNDSDEDDFYFTSSLLSSIDKKHQTLIDIDDEEDSILFTYSSDDEDENENKDRNKIPSKNCSILLRDTYRSLCRRRRVSMIETLLMNRRCTSSTVDDHLDDKNSSTIGDISSSSAVSTNLTSFVPSNKHVVWNKTTHMIPPLRRNTIHIAMAA